MRLVELAAAAEAAVTGVPGVRSAPEGQPPAGGVYAFVWPAAGTWNEITAGRLQGLHTLHVMVATPLRNLRTDWARVLPFGDSVPRALIGAGLWLQEENVRYTFGELEWGGQPMLGWRFEIDVRGISALHD